MEALTPVHQYDGNLQSIPLLQIRGLIHIGYLKIESMAVASTF
jgi:hypothetical protein